MGRRVKAQKATDEESGGGYWARTNNDLKDECRARGLAVGGKKAVLIQRLEGYDKAEEEGKELPVKKKPKSKQPTTADESSKATTTTRKKPPTNGHRASGSTKKDSVPKKTSGKVEKKSTSTKEEKKRAKTYRGRLSEIMKLMRTERKPEDIRKTVFARAYTDLDKARDLLYDIETAEGVESKQKEETPEAEPEPEAQEEEDQEDVISEDGETPGDENGESDYTADDDDE